MGNTPFPTSQSVWPLCREDLSHGRRQERSFHFRMAWTASDHIETGARGLAIDASCIWRWVQVYGPELDKRCRPHLKPTNRSWRLDETYINIKGRDRFLYRAVDSTGQTIDFLLTDRRDAAAAKRFFRRALLNEGNSMPRVINVDKNPAYPRAVEDLKREGAISRRCRLRQCKYLNNVVEQDHRM